MRWSEISGFEATTFDRKKITVVGAGNVGATAAFLAAQKELANIVLIDVVEGVPQGKALDMFEFSPIQRFDASVIGTNDYADTANSDLVIITAGIARKPGMSRDDLLSINANIVADVTRNIVKYSPNCIILVVTNPLDAMVYTALKVSGFPKHRVIGMAGVLDSARMRAFIAEELGVSINNVTAFVLGGHGDTMVPLPRYSTVAGIPITELMSEDRVQAISERTADGGAEIVRYLKTGSAFYAPGAAVVQMAEAIIKDNNRILPCCAYLEGEYGVNGYYLGVPCKLGAGGLEAIIELDLTEEEKKGLSRSMDAVSDLVKTLDGLGLY
ncbi:MAG: malate dehydrogenase [Zetaproteobacteria bacterium CG_4_9_14_3_um_filter_53_7]|nr:MAG: malate dehydrogenase [Zetaproteobacteria bacterium CG_4_9_14_3_um_filter_53_7]